CAMTVNTSAYPRKNKATPSNPFASNGLNTVLYSALLIKKLAINPTIPPRKSVLKKKLTILRLSTNCPPTFIAIHTFIFYHELIFVYSYYEDNASALNILKVVRMILK